MPQSLLRHVVLGSLAASVLLLAGCTEDDGAPATVSRPRGPVVAKCSITIGQVEVRRANGDRWEAISAGAEFERGDLIRTGKGSFVSVKFKTGGGFELEENGLMIIRTADVPASDPAKAPGRLVQQTVVALESGVARGTFEEDEDLLAPLVIEERGGTTVSLAPRGKEAVSFRLSKTERGTEVAVSSGTAVLTSGGKQVSVSKGQAADVRAGAEGVSGGLSEVVELLDFPASVAPGVDARFHFTPALTVAISWKPVAGAKTYRVQVARDLGFQALVFNADVEGTTLPFTPSEGGTYAWRVAARDAAGRQGEFGFARRIFCEQEKPRDLLVAPESGASYAYDRQTPPAIQFVWQSAANASEYRLVIAKTPDLLDGPVVDRRLPEQRAEIAELEAGQYYWGVYLTGASPVPVFNEPRKLLVVKSDKARFQTPKSISTWGKRK